MFAILLILGALTNVVLLHKNQTEVEIQRGKRGNCFVNLAIYGTLDTLNETVRLNPDSKLKFLFGFS